MIQPRKILLTLADVVNQAEGSISCAKMAWRGRQVGVAERGTHARGSPRNLGGPDLSAFKPGWAPGDQAQDPGRSAPLTWERRASADAVPPNEGDEVR